MRGYSGPETSHHIGSNHHGNNISAIRSRRIISLVRRSRTTFPQGVF
jgi:hypothetical protein